MECYADQSLPNLHSLGGSLRVVEPRKLSVLFPRLNFMVSDFDRKRTYLNYFSDELFQ